MRIIVYRLTDGEICEVRTVNADHGPEHVSPEAATLAEEMPGLGIATVEVDDTVRPGSHWVERDGDSIRVVEKPDERKGKAGRRWYRELAQERGRQHLKRSVVRRRSDGRLDMHEDVSETHIPSALFCEADADDVSVVVTCHNYEEYLSECIESILDTEIAPKEIIIVHDKCDDLDASKVNMSMDALRLRAERTDFGNAALSRNHGASLATGSLLLFVDADDKLSQNFIPTLTRALNDPRIALAYPNIQDFGEDAPDTPFRPAPAHSRPALMEANYMPIATLIRRDVFDEVGGFDSDLRAYFDWDLWLRITQGHYIAQPCRDATYYHRKHGCNVSKSLDPIATADAVRQKNARVLIVSAFDAKDYCIEEHMDSLLSMAMRGHEPSGESATSCPQTATAECPIDPRHIELLLIDNSHTPRIRDRIEEFARRLADVYGRVTIEDRSDLPPLERKAGKKWGFAVNQRMIQLYRSVPFGTDCDFILMYENDVIAPPDALCVLLNAMRPRVGAVASTVNARPRNPGEPSPGVQAWDYEGHNPPTLNFKNRVHIDGTEPGPIGTSAWSCLLIRTAVWRKTILRAAKPIYAFDGIFGHDLHELGYKYLLHPGVRCKHMIEEGRYV